MNIQTPTIFSRNAEELRNLDDIQSIHAQFTLCGIPRNAILDLPDDVLLYIISLLKNKIPQKPNISIAQWYQVLSILNAHWVLPLLYWQISHISESSKPPKEIIDALRIKYLRNVAQSIIVEKQLREIVNAFNKENVQILVLKGSALARTVYPDPALRSGSDIDVLVLGDDVPRSRIIMEKLGYNCIKKYYDISKYWYCEEEFQHNDHSKNYLQVEIHWSLNDCAMLHSVNEHQFFDRAIEIKIPGLTFKALSPVDSIIHSATHLCLKHNNEIRVNWIYDISLLCKSLTPEDWITLQQRSVELGARISSEKSIIMAQYWTGLQIPQEFIDFSKWPGPIKNEIETFSYATEGRDNPICRLKFHWPMSAPLQEKIKLLSIIVFPSMEAMKYQYQFKNEWLVIPYYIKRWFELFKRL